MRCSYWITLGDGTETQCARNAGTGDWCEQHSQTAVQRLRERYQRLKSMAKASTELKAAVTKELGDWLIRDYFTHETLDKVKAYDANNALRVYQMRGGRLGNIYARKKP